MNRRKRLAVCALTGLGIAVAACVAKPAWRQCLLAIDVYQARRALDDMTPKVALEWLRGAEELGSNRADVQYFLAAAKRRTGRLGEVMPHLLRADALGWPKKDLKRQRMMLLFQTGNLGEAEPYLLKQLREGVPDETAEEVCDALVRGYMSEFRVHEAAVCLEHWIALRPRSIPPRVWRTEIYGVLESTEKLQAELREILRIDPRRLSQRISLATSLLDVSRVEEALAEYEIARRQAPRDPRVLLGLGLCHRRLGTVAQARGELASALAGVLDDAQRSSALMALGDLALQTRDVEQAAGYFEDAMRLTPHEPAAAYALGTTLSKLGRAEMARQHLERSRILDRQMDRLHDIYSQLIRNTNDAKLRAEAATILRAQNRTQEAAKWMISALRYEPTLREAHQLLADYFEDQGEVQLAQRHRAAARDGTQVAESALVDAGRPEP